MKNMKKLTAMILALMMVVSLAACSSEPAEEASGGMDLVSEETTVAKETEAAAADEVSVEQLVADYFANKPDHSYLIKAADILPRVAADEDIFILDIRSADDYAKGHLKGAVSAPWGGMAIAEAVSMMPADKEVFVYCYSGQTAGQAVMTLNLAGLNARSIAYGWNFGLSKAEGIADLTETTANDFTDTNDVAANVQAAIDAYYAGLSEVSETTFKNYKVSEDGLKGMIDGGEDFFLLSARRPDDFAAAHIAGATNVPYGTSFVEGLANVPKDQKVVVYCYSGQTAGQATAAMKLLGYDAVSLNGGMGTGGNAPLGWTNKGYPVESTSAVYNGVVDYFANKPDHSYLIKSEDILAKVEAGEDIFVLDIRSADDYTAGHLNGAVNAPWGGTAIAEALAMIPADKEVFVYCYSGQTAGQAVMTMNLAGLNARSVAYGWNFGLSKAEGIDAYTETTANELGTEVVNDIAPEIQEAITAYYAGLADVSDSKFKNYKISEDNLATMIEMEESFTLISARRPDDFVAGHIEGAINVPYGKTFVEGLAGLGKNQQMVIYCYSGQTAGQANAAMRLLGYNVVSLNGGMGTSGNDPLGWTNKGYEVVTD